MRCERIQQFYDDYSRGTLSVATMARVEEHLAECPACRQDYELNDAIAQSLRGAGEVAHPGGDYFDALSARVLEKLDDPAIDLVVAPVERGPSLWRHPIWWLGGLSAAALVSLGLFGGGAARSGVQFAAASTASAPTVANALRTAAVAPSIPVVMVTDTRRELVLSPLDGSGKNNSALDLISAMYDQRMSLPPPATNSSPLPSATPAPQIRQVAMRVKSEPASGLPDELAKQFEAIRREMLTQGEAKLYDRLRELNTQIKSKPNSAALESQPLVRQAGLFVKAQDDLAAGRAEEAATCYQRILLVDEKSPLGVRASLQLADLFHNEWADFKEAQKYYSKTRGKPGENALTQTERDHVARQLERLRTHAGNQWDALRQLHAVQRGKWSEVKTALSQLVALPDAGDLLPEAARSIVERVNAEPGAPSDLAIDIYKLLETRAGTEQNGNIRAWLELALGDLQLIQFQQPQGAMTHYNEAIAVGSDSAAAGLARTKRDELINRQLNNLVR